MEIKVIPATLSPKTKMYIEWQAECLNLANKWLLDSCGIREDQQGRHYVGPFRCDVGYSQCTESGKCKGWC